RTFVIEADDTRRLVDEQPDVLERPALRPVRLLREVSMHRGDVDPVAVVVELEAVAELALQADSVRSRNPPCSSYDEVTTASASRRARSVSCARDASASGAESRPSMPTRPSAVSASEPCAWTRQTAPPARGEKPTSCAAPHSTQLVRCSR